AALVVAGAFAASQHTPWLRIEDQASTWVLNQLAGIRTPWLTDVAQGIKAAGTGWDPALRVSVGSLLMIFRRRRPPLVVLGSVVVVLGGVVWRERAGTRIYGGLSRPRPYGVPIITSWAGYAKTSPPVAVVTFSLVGVVYCLAVPGRARTWTKAAVAAVVAVFAL